MTYKQINIVLGGRGEEKGGNRQLSTVAIKVMKVVLRMKQLFSFRLILARIVDCT